jgi:hypothetical protein
VDDYVIYNGKLYRNTTAHSRLAWNYSHFEETTITSEFAKYAPLNHAYAGNKYGLGNARNKGHVALCDDTDSLMDVDAGTAATPLAVNNVRKTLESLMGALGYNKVYYGFYNASVPVDGGDFSVTWTETPDELKLNDIVVIYYAANQKQYAQKFLVVNGKRYDINNGGVTADSTVVYTYVKEANSQVAGGLSYSTLTDIKTTVSKNKLSRGMIMMWSGTINSIPTGWLLCDGTKGTPDLRNRFVVGNDGTSYEESKTGGVASHRLVIDNLPAHAHVYIGDGYIPPYWVKSPATGLWVVDQRDEDGMRLYKDYGMQRLMTGNYEKSKYSAENKLNWVVTEHGWGASGNGNGRLYRTSVTMYSKGNNVDTFPRTYDKNDAPQALDNRPPFYALAFIMFAG